RVRLSSAWIVVPQVDPHCGQTYSYLSPSGRINSRRLRTGTARLHLGHASRDASIRSKAGLRGSLASAIANQNSEAARIAATVAVGSGLGHLASWKMIPRLKRRPR